jgi:thiosulfate dehydrogenase [quinone] large subunit
MAYRIHPQLETQPASPPAQREPPTERAVPTRLHLVHLRHTPPEQIKAPRTHKPNFALVGLQLLVGYEWLVSGGDKLLLGTFPARLGALLTQLVSGGQLAGFFSAILQQLVVPNAILFGYLIEWGETLAGLGLITAGLLSLLRPLAEKYLSGTLGAAFAFGVRLLDLLAPLAAIGAGLLGLSFFFLDGLPTPWFTPSIADGGAIDTGLFLAAASVVLVISHLAQRHQRQ